jgi:hypothetical protein
MRCAAFHRFCCDQSLRLIPKRPHTLILDLLPSRLRPFAKPSEFGFLVVYHADRDIFRAVCVISYLIYKTPQRKTRIVSSSKTILYFHLCFACIGI